MEKKQKRIVIYSGVLIAVLIVVVFVSVVPMQFIEPNGGGGGDPPPEPDPYEPEPYVPPPPPPPSPPVLNMISPNPDPDGTITLRWSQPSGAIGYKIYMSKDGGTWQLIKTWAYTVYSKIGLTNGVYRFKLKAYSSTGTSAYSNIRSVTVSIPPPIVLAPTLQPISPTIDTDGFISLSWSSVSDAIVYKVYKSKDGGEWVSAVNTGATSITVQISINGRYNFGVKASNAYGTSKFSNIQSVYVTIPDPIRKPLAPVLNVISPSIDYDGVIYLDWNDVHGADSYKVYRHSEWGLVRLIASGIKESRYTDKLQIGKYYYQIRATNEAGDSPKSNYGEVTISSGTDPELLPSTPVLKPIVPNPDSDGIITLSWNTPVDTGFSISIIPPPPGGTSYDVFVCGVLIGTTFTNTFTDEITINGVYEYKIRARNGYGVSEYSNIESVRVDIQEEGDEFVPDAPILSPLTYVVKDGETEIYLNWSVVDCDSYNVYKKVDGGSYVLIQSDLISTTYSEVLTEAGVYSYRITAENIYGESKLSNLAFITITEEGEPSEPSDYTVLYVLFGVLGALVVTTIILVKRRKKQS